MKYYPRNDHGPGQPLQTFSVSGFLQPDATVASGRERSTAIAAITAHFEAGHNNVETAITLDLPFESVEEIAFEFRDFSATQACHVHVIALGPSLVVMLLSLQMHQVKFVDQAVSFQEIQGPIHRDTIDLWVDFPRLPENLAGVQVLLRGFHDTENRSPLAGHPQAASHEFGLQASGNFSLRKRHILLQPSCNTSTRHP